MRVAKLSLLVRDYDEAIDWYTRCLGFELAEDVDMGNGKRWVVIEPTGTRGAALLLAKAANPQQEAAIGNQSGGRVFLFLETDSFDRDYAHMLEKGVSFREAPRTEAYGRVVVFEDIYGNVWDLIEPR